MRKKNTNVEKKFISLIRQLCLDADGSLYNRTYADVVLEDLTGVKSIATKILASENKEAMARKIMGNTYTHNLYPMLANDLQILQQLIQVCGYISQLSMLPKREKTKKKAKEYKYLVKMYKNGIEKLRDKYGYSESVKKKYKEQFSTLRDFNKSDDDDEFYADADYEALDDDYDEDDDDEEDEDEDDDEDDEDDDEDADDDDDEDEAEEHARRKASGHPEYRLLQKVIQDYPTKFKTAITEAMVADLDYALILPILEKITDQLDTLIEAQQLMLNAVYKARFDPKIELDPEDLALADEEDADFVVHKDPPARNIDKDDDDEDDEDDDDEDDDETESSETEEEALERLEREMPDREDPLDMIERQISEQEGRAARVTQPVVVTTPDRDEASAWVDELKTNVDNLDLSQTFDNGATASMLKELPRKYLVDLYNDLKDGKDPSIAIQRHYIKYLSDTKPAVPDVREEPITQKVAIDPDAETPPTVDVDIVAEVVVESPTEDAEISQSDSTEKVRYDENAPIPPTDDTHPNYEEGVRRFGEEYLNAFLEDVSNGMSPERAYQKAEGIYKAAQIAPEIIKQEPPSARKPKKPKKSKAQPEVPDIDQVFD